MNWHGPRGNCGCCKCKRNYERIDIEIEVNNDYFYMDVDINGKATNVATQCLCTPIKWTQRFRVDGLIEANGLYIGEYVTLNTTTGVYSPADPSIVTNGWWMYSMKKITIEWDDVQAQQLLGADPCDSIDVRRNNTEVTGELFFDPAANRFRPIPQQQPGYNIPQNAGLIYWEYSAAANNNPFTQNCRSRSILAKGDNCTILEDLNVTITHILNSSGPLPPCRDFGSTAQLIPNALTYSLPSRQIWFSVNTDQPSYGKTFVKFTPHEEPLNFKDYRTFNITANPLNLDEDFGNDCTEEETLNGKIESSELSYTQKIILV